MARIRKTSLATFYVLVLLGTEFLHIDFFGGSVRPYHFLVPLVVVLLWGRFSQIAGTKVFVGLLFFWLANVLSASVATEPLDAFRRFTLLTWNMSISLSIALLLRSGHISIQQLVNAFKLVAVVSLAVSVIQLAAYNVVGVNLGLSDSQQLQVSAGFASGLRTEANSFAKFLNVVFLLVLPQLADVARRRVSLVVFVSLIAGMLLSFTRAALYGLGLTLAVSMLWQLVRGRVRFLSSGFAVVLLIGGCGLVIFASVVSQFNEYAAAKFASFFSLSETLEGGSATVRILAQTRLIDAFFSSSRTIIAGNGWGGVSFELGDQQYQAFGPEILMALSYAGLIGGIAYLTYQFAALTTLRRSLKPLRGADARYAEGFLLATLGAAITGQLSGSLLAPEYWVLYGVAMYYESARPSLANVSSSSTPPVQFRA